MKLLLILVFIKFCYCAKVFKLSEIKECSSSNKDKAEISCSPAGKEMNALNITFDFKGNYTKSMVN